ncbi:hypothetical protein H4R99_000324 [Coemansia sp. RSA 1722]|nr:hypothetical protein LPJ57_003752 [Coemansia sp. RSA 486]KAJ2234034.1 hypothetical protein IWW45_003727 [Coemansia sp. RSA 485]KAJ2606492.1 hypothetical protein H4R99_000324 [Coemansia sp. RSA 1722]KAJ2637989.1 hypothetical protein GGF40_001980 [Coemansia sp. RSA 1286]
MPENLADKNSDYSSSDEQRDHTAAQNNNSKKTFADIVSAPVPGPKSHSTPEPAQQSDESLYSDNSFQDTEEEEEEEEERVDDGAKNSQNEDEYTSDIYTEDEYTDDYTEDSIFSDSNYSGNSDGAKEDRAEETGATDTNLFSFNEQIAIRRSPQNIRPWPLTKEDSGGNVAVNHHGMFDTNFSSGTTSPNPADLLNTTRATEALAPSHRFVSHTPWGSSTGRLTRGQRDRGRLWDDPTMVAAAAGTKPAEEEEEEEEAPGLATEPDFAHQGFPMFDEQLENNSAGQRPSAMANNDKSSFVGPRGSSHDSGAYYQEDMHAYTGSLVNGNSSSSNAAQATIHQQQQQHTRQLQLQMQQQFKQNQQQPNHQQWKSPNNTHATADAAAVAASQVVNVVSVQQGTKGYNELQQQMQRERKLHQDTISGKLLQGQSAPRIVTIAQFIKSVSRLLGIGFPTANCTEARLTVALIAILGVRTGLDVWFSNFNARCVRAVVTYDRATLLRRLLPEYLGMTLPMAAVNQAIKWVISSLTIALRVRLGRYAHQRYVDGITNITWNQLHHQGPNGSTPAFERPDWLLTVQIHRFADMFPRLIADVVKPTIDWFVFSRLLSRVIGRKGSLTMVLYVVLANVIIRVSSPPTGKNASRLAQLEEKYRGVYARISSIIQRAAAASTPLFYQQRQQQFAAERPRDILSPDPSPHGTTPYATDLKPNGTTRQKQQTFVPRVQATFRERARNALDTSLDSVASNVVSTNIRRFFGGIGETMLAKYGATLTAYYLLSRPLCSPGRRLASEILHDPAAVMMSYSRNSAYLINLSQATTRLLLMVNDLPKFIWSTVKVDRLLRSLDVHARYRSAVENMSNEENDHSSYTTD